MDTANNCEAYMSRLIRKEKSSLLSAGLKPPVGSLRTKSIVSKLQPKPKLPSKTPTPHQNSSKIHGCTTCNTEQNAQKELYLDNQIIDIPVKPIKSRTKSNASGDREPWGKILKSSNHGNPSNFSNFDPLRTLHFLAKELQFKLKNDLPDDNNLYQILSDMQHALSRIPQEIASAIQLQNSIELKKSSSSSSLFFNKKYNDEIIIPKLNKSCQTIQRHEDTELIQKMMEGSTLKLEESCRQMEILCGRLKSEKDELETQLKKERDNVSFLKKKIGDLEIQCEKLVSVTIKRLEEEKNELQLQVNKLTDVVETQSIHTSYELKNVAQELKQVQSKADEECTKLKHQLALSNMEKEKYIAILTVRDKQINEIRTEMTQLQDVVNEQLVDIHNKAQAYLPSSLVDDNLWSMKDDIQNNKVFVEDTNTIEELEDKMCNIDLKNSLSNKQSIRNMFAEVKKQAFEMTSKPL